jgi:hypothetical protein
VYELVKLLAELVIERYGEAFHDTHSRAVAYRSLRKNRRFDATIIQ